MTYPEYTIKLEAENKRLQEANKELLEACQYLESVLLIMEKHQCLPIPHILRNNIEVLHSIIAKHTPEAQGSRKELI